MPARLITIFAHLDARNYHILWHIANKNTRVSPGQINNNKGGASSDPPLRFDSRPRGSEKRKNEGPWTLFQGRPTGKARLSYKQALRLWSGFLGVRMPERPRSFFVLVQYGSKTDAKSRALDAFYD